MNKKGSVESTINFSLYTKVLRKQWLKILAVVAAVTAGMYPLVSNITDIYASTATVYIQASEDNISPLSQVESLDSSQAEYYTTQYELAKSRGVLTNAIEALKLDENPGFNGVNLRVDAGLSVDPEVYTHYDRIVNTIQYMREHLTVTGVRKTQLMTITYEDADPQLAADIANAIANAYIDLEAQKRMEKTANAKAWNEKQNAELKAQILAKQREIQKLLKDEDMLTFNGIDGYETDQLALLNRNYAEAKAKRIAAEAEYNTAESYRGRDLEEIITLPMFSDNAQLRDLRSSLTQSKRELYELEKTYGPKHQKVLQANSQITAINEQSEELFEELMETVHKRYESALAEENEYLAQIEEHKKNFHKMAEKKDKYYDLKVDLEQMEALYKSLFVRTKEQQLSLNFQKSNASLYDEAIPAIKPLKPNRIFLMIMIMVVTTIFTCLFLIVKASLNNKVRTMSELEKFVGIKALGEFRKDKKLQNLPVEQVRKTVFSIDSYAEMIHGIRTSIMLDKEQDSTTMGVVSVDENEGSKTISYLLAHSFSEHRKTALVDLDFRSSDSLSNVLVQKSAKGVSDICSSGCNMQEAVVSLDKLDFYSTGTNSASPLSVLASKRFVAFIKSLAAQYEQVIFSLPSCKHSKDAQLVAQHIDSALIVTKANCTVVNNITSTVDKLETAGASVIGGVVNEVEDRDLESEEGLRYLDKRVVKMNASKGNTANKKVRRS
ncbi:polysaccharide biosynthesis tyrosine autokinase [Vibrio hannami]|uniref:GumC family protein n=1 Tax=Vibrio hannami TaxID=2717094 RepID=UPI00240F4775|nr:polysaccharide biosynthesis tyrosine autokinase [Vibrio hannami]MDG3087041.1 polysaccharide biosynthesis tyrosine autokinase [Vibrio hannami]